MVRLRPPSASDAAEFLALVRASRRLHRSWVHPPSTPARFRAWLKRCRRDDFRGLLVCRDDGALVGVFNISQIFLGSFRSAYLGYYVFAPHAGRGYMTEALGQVVRHAFTRLGLHRLEANIQPANRDSIRLVRRCGFRREGFSPRYLKVGGRWRDHERWAIVREDLPSTR